MLNAEKEQSHTHINELSARVATLTGDVKTANDKITEMTTNGAIAADNLKTCQGSLVQLHTEKDALATENSHLKDQDKTSSEKIGTLTTDLATCNSEKETARASLTTVKEESHNAASACDAAKTELNVKIDSLVAELKTAHESNVAVSAEKNALATQNSNLKTDLEACKAAKADLDSHFATAGETNSALTASVDSSKAALNESHALNEKLTADLAASEAKAAESSARLATAQESVSSCEANLSAANSLLAAVRGELDQAKVSNGSLTEEKNALTKDLATCSAKVSALEETNAYIQVTLDASSMNLTQCLAVQDRLKVDVAQQLESSKNLQAELAVVLEEKKTADETNAQLNADLSVSKATLAIAHANLETANLATQEAKAHAGAVQKLLDECKANAESTTTQLSEAQAAHSEAVKFHEECKAASDLFKERVDALTVTAEACPKQVDELTIKISGLTAEKTALETDLVAARESSNLHEAGHKECLKNAENDKTQIAKLEDEVSAANDLVKSHEGTIEALKAEKSSLETQCDTDKESLAIQIAHAQESIVLAEEKATRLTEELNYAKESASESIRIVSGCATEKAALEAKVDTLTSQLADCKSKSTTPETPGPAANCSDLEFKYQICMKDLNNQYAYLFDIINKLTNPNQGTLTNKIDSLTALNALAHLS